MRAPTEPIAYTIPDTCRVGGFGPTTAYQLIGNGTLDARKCGRRTLVMAESLKAYLANLPRLAPKKAA